MQWDHLKIEVLGTKKVKFKNNVRRRCRYFPLIWKLNYTYICFLIAELSLILFRCICIEFPMRFLMGVMFRISLNRMTSSPSRPFLDRQSLSKGKERDVQRASSLPFLRMPFAKIGHFPSYPSPNKLFRFFLFFRTVCFWERYHRNRVEFFFSSHSVNKHGEDNSPRGEDLKNIQKLY